MVTLVPPANGPAFGLTLVTTGTAAGPPDSSSRLALEVAPSVKSRFPVPSERTEVGPVSVAGPGDEPTAAVYRSPAVVLARP